MPGSDTSSHSQGTPDTPCPPGLPLSPWGCCRLAQRLRPPGSCISWAGRPATRLRPADPSERQQPPYPRNTLLSYPLPDEWKVPAALPCPSAGSNSTLTQPDLLYPDAVITLGFSAACGQGVLEPSIPAGSLFLGWTQGQSPSLLPAPRSELTAHCQSGCSCVVFAAGGCCLSFG